MKLINNPPSPYGRKAVIALIEKGLPFEIVEDMPWGESTIASQYNPLEQVPILLADHGEAIYESDFILEWLERRYPRPSLLPPDDDGILDMKRLQVLAGAVQESWFRLFAETQRATPAAAWMERQKRKVARGLAEIARLVGGREYAVSGRFTLADIAVGTLLGSLDFLREQGFDGGVEGRWREQQGSLVPYAEGLERRESFRRSRQRAVPIDVQAIFT